MPVAACIFDAYGTLFDVAGAARAAAAEPEGEALGEVWEALASDWRAKQLEYSWLRAITGQHVPFWEVTVDGLDWALERSGIEDDSLRTRLLDLYRVLPAYPEAADCLAALKAAGKTTAILSNGSPDMLRKAVTSSGLDGALDAVLSVEAVGIYKPACDVYDLVGKTFGVPSEAVLFVSSNGWDVAGAASYGFRTVWVNRSGLPVDRLPGRPDVVAKNLSDIPPLAVAA